MLVVGAQSTDRSAVVTALMERFCEQGYTFCVIDAEGRYGEIAEAVSLGSSARPPTTTEVVKLLQGADNSGVINLAGLPWQERQPFLEKLLAEVAQLRARLGRPHWLVLDDTQNLLAAQGDGRGAHGESVVHITERPGAVARDVLQSISLIIVLGAAARRAALLQEFAQATGRVAPTFTPTQLSDGEAVAWRPREAGAAPLRINITTSQPANGLGGSAAVVATTANLRAAKTSRLPPN
jgi:hypothetical protein